MTIAIANLVANTNNLGDWFTKTNQLADAVSTQVVTVDGDVTSGNAVIDGSVQAETLYADELAGGEIGNTQTLTITTDLAISGNTTLSNLSFNGSNSSIGLAANVHVLGGNSSHYILAANNSTNRLRFIRGQTLESLSQLGTSGRIAYTANTNEWAESSVKAYGLTLLNTANVAELITNAGFGNTVLLNSGPGEGLDADTVDGFEAASLAKLAGAAFTGNVSISGNFTTPGITDANTYTVIIGGNTAANGSAIALHGSSNTNAFDIEFRHGANVVYRWDDSANSHAFKDSLGNNNIFVANTSGAYSGSVKLLGTADIGNTVQAYDADTLKADTTDNLTAGYTVSVHDLGTISSGTVTPAFANGNIQKYTNSGAHTFAQPTGGDGTMIVRVFNSGAGAITFSGFNKIDGDTYTTTSSAYFMFFVSIIEGVKYLSIKRIV